MAAPQIVIKAGKYVLGIISAKVVEYITSEEFRKQIKKMLEKLVNSMAELVYKEINSKVHTKKE